MQNCKRYKSTANGIEAVYHTQDAVDCRGCVYFSSQNCRMHTGGYDVENMNAVG